MRLAAAADTASVTQRPLHLLALAAFATVTPVAVIAFVGERQVYLGGWPHVIGVGVGAAIASISALALTVAGARQRDGRAVLGGVRSRSWLPSSSCTG